MPEFKSQTGSNGLTPDISEEHKKLDSIYNDIPLHEIPWNTETPPEVLVKLIRDGVVKPCRCIDLGCGAGNFAIYMSGKGFDVTGVDVSANAVKIARENALKAGAKCEFVRSDINGDMAEVEGTFDFAYDWEVLHHIYPDHRDRYIKNVHRILNPDSKYLSVCFSEKNSQFGGKGKYRKTPLGTILYFSSEEELRALFSSYFRILEIETIEVPGKYGIHAVNYALMERV